MLRALDRGEECPAFLEGITDEYREILSRYPALRQKWERLIEALADLTANERSVVREAVISQNDLPAVLTNRRECVQCRDRLPVVHARAEELFRVCFERLGRIRSPDEAHSIRDNQYSTIFPQLPKKCCPFCGLEIFEPFYPGIARPQIDHYLPITIYPFAGANLRNLIPMGSSCNTAYKKDIDLLYDHAGRRTQCFDPYGNLIASVSMENSQILTTPGGGLTGF